ncbi:MAG TPA: hypothetical protein VIY51_24435 [Xanthobacteraceae bacterium]
MRTGKADPRGISTRLATKFSGPNCDSQTKCESICALQTAWRPRPRCRQRPAPPGPGAHPDTVKRFKAAINESLAYADEHPDEVRAIVPTYTRISKELIGKLTLPRWPTEMNRKSTEILADLSVKDGLVSKQPDLNAFFR